MHEPEVEPPAVPVDAGTAGTAAVAVVSVSEPPETSAPSDGTGAASPAKAPGAELGATGEGLLYWPSSKEAEDETGAEGDAAADDASGAVDTTGEAGVSVPEPLSVLPDPSMVVPPLLPMHPASRSSTGWLVLPCITSSPPLGNL